MNHEPSPELSTGKIVSTSQWEEPWSHLVRRGLLGGERAFPTAQQVKNLPAVQEMQVRSLGWEDSLQENMVTHSSIAWTMEYYSAIKKNTIESVLMRWMKLEPVIQSEVSQKDKHQYSILTHIYGI